MSKSLIVLSGIVVSFQSYLPIAGPLVNKVMDHTKHVIDQVVAELAEKRVILNGHGYCFAMAEIVQTMLSKHNIASRLVECQLTLIQTNPPKVQLVGHGVKNGQDNEFDTHMVCVTDTTPAYLIDLSLGANLVVPTVVKERGIIADCVNEHGQRLIYRQKPNPLYPPILNQNIIARMQADLEIRSTIKTIKWIVIVAIIISTLNFVRGIYDYYQTWVDDRNDWGPNAVQRIEKRLEKLEQESPRARSATR